MTDNFREAARILSGEYVPLTYELNGKQIANDLITRYVSYVAYNCKATKPISFSYEASDNQVGLQIVSFNSPVGDVSLDVKVANTQITFSQHSVSFNVSFNIIPVIITIPSRFTCTIVPDKDMPVLTIYAIRCAVEPPIVINA